MIVRSTEALGRKDDPDMDATTTLIYAVAVLVTLDVAAVSLRRSDSKTRTRRVRRST
jgi:hypothetical protein